MANATHAHLEDHQGPHNERPRDEQAIQRRKEQEREAHARNVEAAYRLVRAFNQHAYFFRKCGVAYCLDEEEPPFAPAICLFRRGDGRNPEITFIPVIVGGEHEIFSLRLLSKRKTREQSGFFTNITKFYEEHHTHLSDDPEEAAREVMRLLSTNEMKFERLWKFDKTMAKCVRQYFTKRDMRRALVVLVAVVATALLSILSRGWR